MADMLPGIRAVKSPKRHAFMAQPFKHSKAGGCCIRRRVPAGLAPLLGREFKRSLGTKYLAEAKPLFLEPMRPSDKGFQASHANVELRHKAAHQSEKHLRCP